MKQQGIQKKICFNYLIHITQHIFLNDNLTFAIHMKFKVDGQCMHEPKIVSSFLYICCCQLQYHLCPERKWQMRVKSRVWFYSVCHATHFKKFLGNNLMKWTHHRLHDAYTKHKGENIILSNTIYSIRRKYKVVYSQSL